MRWLVVTAASFLVLAAAAIEPPQPAPGAAGKPGPAKQEPAPAPEESEPAEEEPEEDNQAGEKAAEDAAPDSGPEEELPPLPAGAPTEPPPQRFNPTEKVRADFPVSFPIDI